MEHSFRPAGSHGGGHLALFNRNNHPVTTSLASANDMEICCTEQARCPHDFTSQTEVHR